MHFDDAHAFITNALRSGSSVLVHCRAGVSRSAAVVVSFLMTENKWWAPFPSQFAFAAFSLVKVCLTSTFGFLSRFHSHPLRCLCERECVNL